MGDHWVYKLLLKSDQPPLTEEQHYAAQEQKLAEWAKALSDREKALSDWKDALEEKKNANDNDEKASSDLENLLSDREKALADREKDLTDRENALLDRAADMERREGELEQREKVLLESALSQPEPESRDRDLSKEMKELIATYKSFSDQVKQTSRDVVALSHEVKGWHQDGLEALCSLCREMMLSKDQRLITWGQRMELILERRFHAEALVPQDGDNYEPELHERVDASLTGQKVLKCLAKGWQREGEVLLRAVVRTE